MPEALFINMGYPAWISNHQPSKMWDEITWTSPNFNGCTVEVWKWTSCFISHFIIDVNPFWLIRQTMLVKWASDSLWCIVSPVFCTCWQFLCRQNSKLKLLYTMNRLWSECTDAFCIGQKGLRQSESLCDWCLSPIKLAGILIPLQVCEKLPFMSKVPSIMYIIPDNKVHGANMGPIWGLQGSGGPHAGRMNLAMYPIVSDGTVSHHVVAIYQRKSRQRILNMAVKSIRQLITNKNDFESWVVIYKHK